MPLGLHQGELLFRMDTSTRGVELWSTDGTREGTAFIADLNPGLPSSHVGPTTRTEHGDFVFGARLGEDEQGVVLMKLTSSGRLVRLFRASDRDSTLLQLAAARASSSTSSRALSAPRPSCWTRTPSGAKRSSTRAPMPISRQATPVRRSGR
ncbi:hypothetical protein LY474_30580 [Myxococcus stipitatus]|uniref:hypothetical protein n=1 Tax=Myxococcus stipitatus TaxID=83455 RepID=UPI001F4156BD|nr:hypothetical protein [Myxococcus stipitatus]MCE9672162.1 hypothetical protein [Myxococcus stipitatus]